MHDVVTRCEALAERERRRRRTVRPEVLEPCDGFLDRRDRVFIDPPQAHSRLRRGLEELSPPTQELSVPRPIGEVGQRLDRFPDREVDDRECVVERIDARRVAAVVFETPHEAGTRLRQFVDRIQVRTKVVDHRVVDRRTQSRDVQLGEVHAVIVTRQRSSSLWRSYSGDEQHVERPPRPFRCQRAVDEVQRRVAEPVQKRDDRLVWGLDHQHGLVSHEQVLGPVQGRQFHALHIELDQMDPVGPRHVVEPHDLHFLRVDRDQRRTEAPHRIPQPLRGCLRVGGREGVEPVPAVRRHEEPHRPGIVADAGPHDLDGRHVSIPRLQARCQGLLRLEGSDAYVGAEDGANRVDRLSPVRAAVDAVRARRQQVAQRCELGLVWPSPRPIPPLLGVESPLAHPAWQIGLGIANEGAPTQRHAAVRNVHAPRLHEFCCFARTARKVAGRPLVQKRWRVVRGDGRDSARGPEPLHANGARLRPGFDGDSVAASTNPAETADVDRRVGRQVRAYVVGGDAPRRTSRAVGCDPRVQMVVSSPASSPA